MQMSLKCYGELAELTVDDIWQITDAGDQELRRLAHSSRWGTMELGAEDYDEVSQQVCTALAEENQQCRSSRFSRDRPQSYFRVPVTRHAAAFWTCFEHCSNQFLNDVWHSCHNHCSQYKTHIINIHTDLNSWWTTFTATFLLQYLLKYQSRLSAFCNANLCDLPDLINCQFCEFAIALLAHVHYLLSDQQSGIHCLIICTIQLLTLNNLGGTWRCICSPKLTHTAIRIIWQEMKDSSATVYCTAIKKFW